MDNTFETLGNGMVSNVRSSLKLSNSNYCILKCKDVIGTNHLMVIYKPINNSLLNIISYFENINNNTENIYFRSYI